MGAPAVVENDCVAAHLNGGRDRSVVHPCRDRYETLRVWAQASRRKNGIRSAGMRTSMSARQSTAASAMKIRSSENLKPSSPLTLRYAIRNSPGEGGGTEGWRVETHLGLSQRNASGSPIRRHRGLEGELPQLGQVDNTGQWPRGQWQDRVGDLEPTGLSHGFESGSSAT